MRRLLLSSFVLGAWLASAPVVAAEPSPQARVAFERAEKALAANQLDVAASGYQEALAAAPGYAPATNGLGSVLFKQGKKDEAIAKFREAIRADPSFKLAYFNLGYAARKSSDFSSAATAYEKYTQLDSNDPDGFYGLAESYRQLEQPQKAIAAYEAFLAREKRPTEQKWIDRAKESLATLRAGTSESAAVPAPAAPATGTPAGSAGAPARIIAAPSAPTNAAPSVSLKRIAEGDRLMQEKKYRDALFAYQDAANADAGNVEALFKLGNTYALLGYYSQAIERWNRVSQLSPDEAIKKNAQDNVTRAQAKMVQVGGGSPQAQGKAPGTGPVADTTRGQARQAYELGVKQINARDYISAFNSLSSAIQLEPTLTVAFVARGSAQIGLRRFSEAAADYQYALKLDGSMASPLYGLAEAYRALNRPSDARGYYEKYSVSTAGDARTELQSEARNWAEKLKAQIP